MNSPIQILQSHWGHASFRPLQEEIIQSVLDGKDTLALLPTGGGKSICFQIPALALDGICIVVSPLIALMKDQVNNLNNRGIKALCITSEYDASRIDALFDRCIYDKEIKFLYLSPERLESDLAKARIQQMKVNLIAVDEAHCISEWGYDFRPSYLQIANIRSLHPSVPVIALTASATSLVVKDIQDKLKFKKPNVFKQSFERPNLAYFVDWDEDILGKIERIAIKQKGSGIIYIRSRKGTERVTRELKSRGISADFYHAGLDSQKRTEKQEAWMNGNPQIIVATNAFGMGIDKPDVRFVIHLDLPDTIENYYQECGRAGRDGKKSFAISILNDAKLARFKEKSAESFPEKEDIKRVYGAMCNLLQLATGSAQGETYALPLDTLCKQYEFEANYVMRCLKFLEREGYIAVNESRDLYSQVMIISDHESMYRLKLNNAKMEPLIDAMLRSYSRLFDEYAAISEWTLAKRARWPKDQVEKGLEWMMQSGYIDYKKATPFPKITFVRERIDTKRLRISPEHYQLRKQIVEEKSEAMYKFATSKHLCRSRMVLNYFGESDASNCGQCDVCLISSL